MCAGIFGGVVQDVPLTRKGIRNETKAGWAKYSFNVMTLTFFKKGARAEFHLFNKPKT